MQEINQLKQLKDKIVGIEMHLTLIQSDMDAIDRDIDFLEDLATVLKENIEVLKSDEIIAVAAQYKQVVAEFKTVNENLSYYYGLKSQLNADITKYGKVREDTILEYEDLKKQVDSRKIILLFDPSKRKK